MIPLLLRVWPYSFNMDGEIVLCEQHVNES